MSDKSFLSFIAQKQHIWDEFPQFLLQVYDNCLYWLALYFVARFSVINLYHMYIIWFFFQWTFLLIWCDYLNTHLSITVDQHVFLKVQSMLVVEHTLYNSTLRCSDELSEYNLKSLNFLFQHGNSRMSYTSSVL